MKRILMTLCAALTLGAASAAGTTPASTFIVVDLPAPLRPISATAAPTGTARSRPWTA